MSWFSMMGNRLGGMRRRPVYLLLSLLLAITGYFAVCQVIKWLPFTEDKRVEYRDISYDSSHDPNPWQVKVKSEDPGEFDRAEIEISFQLLVDSIEDYDNVFQTAPWNEGIRLELAKPAKLAFVIPEKRGGPGSIRGFYLTQQLQFRKWYRVRLRINPEQRFQAWLNDFPAIDIQDAGWAYAVSEVALGTGFNRTRPFHGKIADFTICYQTWKPEARFLLPLLFVRALFVVLSVILAAPLCFYSARWAGPAIMRWIQPPVGNGNLLLGHFLICSGGLIKLLIQSAEFSARQLSASPPVLFNDWTLRFVFPSKPSDLATYGFGILVLPVYYAIAYLFLRFAEGKAYRFFAHVGEKQRTIAWYLGFLVCGNLLVVFLNRLLGGGPLLLLQSLLWLCLFFTPWYLAPRAISPYIAKTGRRSSEEPAL